jgi:hypothetical protein
MVDKYNSIYSSVPMNVKYICRWCNIDEYKRLRSSRNGAQGRGPRADGADPRLTRDPYIHRLTDKYNSYIHRLSEEFNSFFTNVCFHYGEGASKIGTIQINHVYPVQFTTIQTKMSYTRVRHHITRNNHHSQAVQNTIDNLKTMHLIS